ncbi:hypothetical protein Glove_365g249 [Diversispora epigaea]|uniref:Uncharacterized protein n=1 Tax=Diversispora epigaea TaxID=1348612 RepID=A0A397HCM9_9GLOM|nr:hypothetical protein Glove_365g249 [Diversispora epigaea]
MAKIRSYYISNSEKELKFYDKDESVITYNAFEDGILEKENLEILEESENLEENGTLNENNELENNSYEENENDELVSSTNLDLSQFVDLTLPEFLSLGDILISNNRPERSYYNGNTEYDPIALAQRVLNEENGD